MVNYNVPRDLIDQIKRLEDRIESLERRPRATNTSIDTGFFRVTDTNGDVVFEAGEFPYPYDPTTTFRGIGFLRQGTVPGPAGMLFGEREGVFGPNILSLYDYSGNNILSDDTLSGQGLARPYVSMIFKPIDFNAWPFTTSATFVSILDSWYTKQHPNILITSAIYSPTADTAGELQVICDGTPVGSISVFTAGFGAVKLDNIMCIVPGGHISQHSIQIQIRRTAGTGNVYGHVLGAMGWQS